MEIEVRKTLQDAAHFMVGVKVIAFRQARRSYERWLRRKLG
jgi:hypothetical protein